MLLLVFVALIFKIFTYLLLIGDIVCLFLPKLGPNVLQMIEGNGYPLERHGNLETEDGYILEMQRIPYGRNNQNETNKIPVLVLHGILASPAEFVIGGPGKGLAYILADEGYDVWLGNNRGNAWSRNHTTYSADFDRKKFWDFSFHEMAMYDLPAMIDYILNKTGHKKLHYIAHSQGTTQFFASMSLKPEYNKKIRLMNALAPVAFNKNIKSPLKIFATLVKGIEPIFWDTFGIYEFLPKSDVYGQLARIFCSTWLPFIDVCEYIIFAAIGTDKEQYNNSLSVSLFSYLPSGSSFKQFLHFLQGIQSDRFRQYNFFSKAENKLHYGQEEPPDYNLANVVVPVALHYGKNDYMSAVEDVERLGKALPNVVVDNLIEYEKFNHFDFLLAKDVHNLLYTRVLEIMKRH